MNEKDLRISFMNYENSDVLLNNPNRGFRMETYIIPGKIPDSYLLSNEDPFKKAKEIIEKYKADKPTLCQVYIYLSNYKNKKIDAKAFSQIESLFEIFRKSNIRISLRFAYSTEDVDDAPYKTVAEHLIQIQNWFEEKRELINAVLYCLQIGIIGYWGEGHSYHNLKRRYFKNIINKAAEIAPKGIYTQVRTYKMLKLANKDIRKFIGIHDDYIVGDMNHKWSFIPMHKRKKIKKVIEYIKETVNDGEMPWGYAFMDDKESGAPINSLNGKNVLTQLFKYSLTSFSLEHNYCEKGEKTVLKNGKTIFFHSKKPKRSA